MSQRFFSQSSLARSDLRRLSGMDSQAIFPPGAGVSRTPVPTTVGAGVTSVQPPQPNQGGAPALRFNAASNSIITLPGAGQFWGATAPGSTDGGLNQYLRFGNLGQFTVEFWINFSSAQGQPGLFEHGTNGTFIAFQALNSVYFGITNVDFYFTNNVGLSLNTWNYLAWSRRRDGNNNKLGFWLNGNFVAERQDANANWTGATTNPFIGQAIGSSNFDGHLQDFRISNIARYLPNVNFTPPQSKLINDANTVFLLSGDSPIQDKAS